MRDFVRAFVCGMARVVWLPWLPAALRRRVDYSPEAQMARALRLPTVAGESVTFPASALYEHPDGSPVEGTVTVTLREAGPGE